MINHILAASRIPWILEQKGIDVTNLLTVNIESKGVVVLLYKVENVMKFEGFEFSRYKEQIGDAIGTITVEFEGIKFTSCVRVEEAQLLNLA